SRRRSAGPPRPAPLRPSDLGRCRARSPQPRERKRRVAAWPRRSSVVAGWLRLRGPAGGPAVSGGAGTVAAVTEMLLVRHGQSEWNAVGRWQGSADPALTELGRLQAPHAASRGGAFDVIVASPLIRALETARLISNHIGVGPVV